MSAIFKVVGGGLRAMFKLMRDDGLTEQRRFQQSADMPKIKRTVSGYSTLCVCNHQTMGKVRNVFHTNLHFDTSYAYILPVSMHFRTTFKDLLNEH